MSETNDLLSVQLLVNGKVSNAILKKVEVHKGVNKISKAKFVLLDGSSSKEDFKLSDSSEFVPGNKIEIKAGYHSKEKTIFKGLLLSQTISVDSKEGSSLMLTCKDETVITSIVRKNTCFYNCTDSDIITKVLNNYALSKSIENTSSNYEKVVQYNVTDWDFIISRANINGLLVTTNDGHLTLSKPTIDAPPVTTLTYGEDIIELNLSVSSEEQVVAVEAMAWDTSRQSIVKATSQEPKLNNEGNITGKTLAKVLNANTTLQSAMPLDSEALKTRANSKLLNSRLSRIQGTLVCEGNVEIKPNTLVKIDGVGKRLNGDSFVSSVSHFLEAGQWLTEIEIGLQNKWLKKEVSVNSLNIAKEISTSNGLQIGKVKKIDSDPKGEFRVQVTLPFMESSNEGIWARLSTLYASNGSGSFFYPEVGDEVILGFLDDNPSAPIIIGSVYSKANAPKFTPNENNLRKAIVTKSGMSISFDEEDKSIAIETPDQNKIILSDNKNGITITDQNNNVVELNTTGIVMNSHKDIILKATNNISFEGTNININANSDLNMSSLNTQAKASLAYTTEGGARAELKSSGNVAVKGVIVEIN